MTRSQFNEWLDELRKRLPDTYVWLQRSPDTAAVWFADVFSELEPDIALSALSHVWSEGLAAYDREKLPAIIMKKHGEIAWRRGDSQRKAEDRKRNVGDGFYSSDRPHIKSMRKCYLAVCKIEDENEVQQKAKRQAFIDEWFGD